jgi:hypothetical protein
LGKVKGREGEVGPESTIRHTGYGLNGHELPFLVWRMVKQGLVQLVSILLRSLSYLGFLVYLNFWLLTSDFAFHAKLQGKSTRVMSLVWTISSELGL